MEHIEYKDRKQIYIQAIKHYGAHSQLVKAVEELSECTQQLCKALLFKLDLDHLAEEVADATIMLEQVRVMMDINEDVHKQMDYKLLRLQERILKDKGEERIPTGAVLDCENCGHYVPGDEICMHQDGPHSDACIWKEES